MTEAQRRYMHARDKVLTSFILPVQEFLDATSALCAAETQRADNTQKVMDELRPIWAQGFTSDSEAAQANGNALAEIWQVLGVVNQTAAMTRLRELLATMHNFCDRVEAGEVRSRRTYSKFCQLLGREVKSRD